MTFKEIFRKYRLEMNLSQKEIAEDLGVSFSLVSQWERGVCSPNPEMLEIIADYFYISINELLGCYTKKDAETLPQFRDLPLERYKTLSPEDKKIIAQHVNLLIDLIERKPESRKS